MASLALLLSCLLLAEPGQGELRAAKEEIREEMKMELKMLKEEMMNSMKEEVLRLEKTQKAELEEMKEELAAAKSEQNKVRDMPYLFTCAYTSYWSTANSTITFDYLITDFNNADRPGGGDGDMDISTGVFTCFSPGFYTVTFSGHVDLGPGEMAWLRLVHNGNPVFESYWQSSSSSNVDYTRDQGSRSLVRREGLH
jgi:hypothetical protein